MGRDHKRCKLLFFDGPGVWWRLHAGPARDHDLKVLQERCFEAERALKHLPELAAVLQRRIDQQGADKRATLQEELRAILAGIKAAERAQHQSGGSSESRADPMHGPSFASQGRAMDRGRNTNSRTSKSRWRSWMMRTGPAPPAAERWRNGKVTPKTQKRLTWWWWRVASGACAGARSTVAAVATWRTPWRLRGLVTCPAQVSADRNDETVSVGANGGSDTLTVRTTWSAADPDESVSRRGFAVALL